MHFAGWELSSLVWPLSLIFLRHVCGKLKSVHKIARNVPPTIQFYLKSNVQLETMNKMPIKVNFLETLLTKAD